MTSWAAYISAVATGGIVGAVGALAGALLLAGACAGPGPRTGTLTVLAAASLTDAFTTLGQRFEAADGETRVVFSFAGSSSVAEQVRAGAPADVVATADEATMNRLVAEDLVETPQVFARNRVAIVVASRNPKGIRSLADLGRDDITLVLCAAEVPCGSLAARALEQAGVDPRPRSYEPNVKAVVSRVALGEADAGIVYASDVRAAGLGVAGVEIPPDQNLTTSYPVAAVTAGRTLTTARSFISFVLSDEGRRVLDAAGFSAP